MNNKEIAIELVELVGGKDNIASVTNCMTRIRFNIKDKSKIASDKLGDKDYVLGVVDQDTYQVVVGPGKAKRITDELINAFDFAKDPEIDENWEDNKQAVKSQQKQSKFKTFLSKLSNIFIPLLPAIIAAGLLNGFAGLATNLLTDPLTGELTRELPLIVTFMQLIGGAFFAYFVIFTGINSAKVFGATEALGGMIGAITIAPQIAIISESLGLETFIVAGNGGIIGVVAGVLVLAKIEKQLRKVIPEVLDLILTPLIAITIMGVLLIFIIMQIAGVVEYAMISVLEFFILAQGPLRIVSGFILSALFLPMVTLGLHHSLIPFYLVQLDTYGLITLFPILAMAGAGQVGAALSIWRQAKKQGDVKMTNIIKGAIIPGFLGIGEPLIYGVTLPLGKPFVTAGIGAGFGGAFIAAVQVGSYAFGPSGLTAIPLMNKPVMYLIGLIIAYTAGFIVTEIAYKYKRVV